jgi:hypothetical protein
MSIKFFLKTSNGQQVTAKCMLALGIGWMLTAQTNGQEQRFTDAVVPQATQTYQAPGYQVRAQLESELQPGEQLIAPGLPKPPAPPQPQVIAGNGIPGGYFTNGNAVIADSSVIQGHHAALGYAAVGQQGGLHHGGSHHGGTHATTGCGPYGNDLCGVYCHDGYVATAEALWIMREGEDNFSLSREFALGGFNHEMGTRFTFGSKWNCTDGWEVGFTGPIDWVTTGSRNVNVANPDSALFTSGGFPASDLDAFNDATFHSQTYRTEYQSFEINKKSWAWDIFSVVYGVRIMDIEEDLTFFSEGAGGNDGLFIQQTDNTLIGLHIGGESMFPMSQRLMVGQRGRLGVAANFFDGSTFVNNGVTTLVNRGNDDEGLACFAEWGVLARYRLYRSLYLTAGYEFWYIDGIALAVDQPITNVNPAQGSVFFANDELFFHGGSVGVEILF